MKVEIVTPNSPKAILDNYEDYFNDGKWHTVVLTINTNLLILNIDNRPMRTVRILKMTTGGIYYIGGKYSVTKPNPFFFTFFKTFFK